MTKKDFLKKLVEKREGVHKSEFGRTKAVSTLIKELIKDGLVKEGKIGRKKYLFITEKGEREFIKLSDITDRINILNERLVNIEKKIDEIREEFSGVKELLHQMVNLKIPTGKVDIPSEIYRVYKELSDKSFSYLGGLVPIPSITAKLMTKFSLSKDEIHRTIYDLYLKGKVLLEMGDKREGNLVTPDGKKYYYLKFKK